MPLYEYRCLECGQVFEVRQKFSDAPLTVHKDCGGAVERLLSPPALQFKGSGWYVTDYGHHSSSPAPAGTHNTPPSKDTAPTKPASPTK